MPGNDVPADHQRILITRGLQEIACLLPQDVPFVTAARLLGWQTEEPGLLCASTLRTLVRDHGGRIRGLEHTEAVCVLRQGTKGRRRAGWPKELRDAGGRGGSGAGAGASSRGKRPPAGLSEVPTRGAPTSQQDAPWRALVHRECGRA